jgi:cytochrome c-type biogenesis protein CcmH
VVSLILAAMLLSLATIGLLLLPVFVGRWRGTSGSRARFDLQVYRDQLAEVDRDAARGLLGREEAQAARIEVKRRMLAATEALEATKASVCVAVKGAGIARVAVAIAIILPTGAALLYLALGEPRSPDRPLAAREAERAAVAGAGDAQTDSLETLTAQLEKKLENHPDEPQGWFLLGRSYMMLQRYADAAVAFRRALQLAPDRPEVARGLAEALIAATGGRVDDEARAALDDVLALVPTNPEARFLLALDKAQRGDLRGAVQGWVDLLALSPADAPWLPVVREHLDKAARQAGLDASTVQPSAAVRTLAARQPAPPPEANAADGTAAVQITSDERAQMIRSMVQRLADRLHDNPDDLDGWRRLAHAYEVLGEPDQAREARTHIEALERR